MNKTVARLLQIAFVSATGFLLTGTSKASPSQSYWQENDCWNSPDFISPKGMNYRFCIRANGIIEKINLKGEILDQRITLNNPIKEKEKAAKPENPSQVNRLHKTTESNNSGPLISVLMRP